MNALKQSSLKEVKINVTHSWADIFSKKYLFMTIYGCVIYLFFNLNGANALLFYSTQIFRIGTGLEAQISARQGTLLMGFVMLLSPIASIFLIQKFS